MSTAQSSLARTPAPLLVVAASVAGFGLGLLGLAATQPGPAAAPLPEPGTRHMAPEAGTGETTPAAQAPWGALFGMPAPAQVAPPPQPVVVDAPDDIPDDAPEFDETLYVLRGVVVSDEGGWALLETEGGVRLVRPGDVLDDGEEVLEIFDGGIELSVDDEVYVITFDDESEPGDLIDIDDADPASDRVDDGPDRGPVGGPVGRPAPEPRDRSPGRFLLGTTGQ